MVAYVPAARLNDKPNDNRQDDRFPTCRKGLLTLGAGLAGSLSVVSGVHSEKLFGKLVGVFLALPDFPTDTTVTLNIYDSEISTAGLLIGTKASIADAGNAFVNLDSVNIYLFGKVRFEIDWTTAIDFDTNTLAIDVVPVLLTP